MTRRVIFLTILLVSLYSIAFLSSMGCTSNSGPFGDPLYINPGEDPFTNNDRYVMSIAVIPSGVNIAVGGLQQFTAVASYNDGTTVDVSMEANWFSESPNVGAFEIQGGRFLAKNPGVTIIRCQMSQGLTSTVVSQAAYINSFNPNADLPPAVPLNPGVLATDEGVLVEWDINMTDGDMAGYNIWRTQVSAAHYASDYGRINASDGPILYPPYMDETVVTGWYYYRVTAEDILGVNSAPSPEVAVFVTGHSHYADSYNDAPSAVQEENYKDIYSTAF